MSSLPSSSTGQGRTNLYQEITDKIIGELAAGRLPWVQPWGSAAAKAPLDLPTNAATGRRYSGVNILILWDAVVTGGFASQGWLTFRQALALGGHVRRGAQGVTVVFADRFTPHAERRRAEQAGRAPEPVLFLKRFTVFNVGQCDGLPAEIAAPSTAIPEDLVLPQAAALIAATGADVRVGGDQAFYSPTRDYVQVPHPEAYFEPVNWHRTALHELGHWTGHLSRLGRDQSGDFGSAAYAKEELVAEMASAFTCAALGISPTVRHADYVGAWLDVLHVDSRAIVRAASAASKAADYLLAAAPGPAVPSK